MSERLAGLHGYRIGRRRLLGVMGTGALGLAAAALIGCGDDDDDEAPAGRDCCRYRRCGCAVRHRRDHGHPDRPGRSGPGGTYSISGSNLRQHDMHTALGSTVWHAITDKVLEIDTMTGEVLPHQAAAWEVIDPEGLDLRLTLRPDIFMQNVAPWNGRQWTAHDIAWNIERMAGFTAEEEGIAQSTFQRASMV